MRRILFILAILTVLSAETINAQSNPSGSNVVSSAVPFLTIAPDSRGGAMGDAGAATLPDINSQFWNPAKYAFIKSQSGVAISYTPWLSSLVDDMNLAYLVGYHKLDDLQTFSASLRYFDLGQMIFFDNSGNEVGLPSNPNEFSVDLAYALKLSDNWSGSVGFRYILSDIYSGAGSATNTVDLKAGNIFAADVAFYYNKDFFKSRKESNVAFGINISNLTGAKISYDGGSISDFIPTNLRVGGAYTTAIDKYNKISFALDLNKLLVPTIPQDSLGNSLFGLANQDKSAIEGVFASFTDAPNGFKEELQEITLSFGAEYWYSEQFALRTGYFHEATNKGDRKFLTFGAGLKMNVFSIDFSYIYTIARRSPLENTVRFTLGFDLDNFRNQGRR